MLAAAVLCPCPPLLHPDVSVGAAAETQHLREACVESLRTALRSGRPDLVVTVGIAPRTGPYPVGARGSLHGFGVDVVLGGGTGPVELPPALALAAWLLDAAGHDGSELPFGVAATDGTDRCLGLGQGLADRAESVLLVVAGEGSACRDAKAPGAFDPRAEELDARWLGALAAVDVAALAALPVALCDELLVSGRAPWQVAAGSARARTESGAPALVGRVRAEGAPYGVGYAVVEWDTGA